MPGFHSVRRSTGMMLVSTWAELGRGEQQIKTARITVFRTDTPEALRSRDMASNKRTRLVIVNAPRPGTPTGGYAFSSPSEIVMSYRPLSKHSPRNGGGALSHTRLLASMGSCRHDL